MNSNSYYDFHAVVESNVTVEDASRKFEVISEGKFNAETSFYRYKAALMTATGQPNRNGRIWPQKFVDTMIKAPHIIEMMEFAGGLPGENGHPIPPTGQVSMERIVTIDPNNVAILIKKWWWEGELLMGIVDTLNEGVGSPGYRLMRDIEQGVVPAHSARTLVPQRRNADGTISVTAPGRFVTVDRVYGPSCKEAYRSVDIPVKNIVKKSEFDSAMENFTSYALEHSEAVKYVLDKMNPAMETASIDRNGTFSVKTENHGHIFIPMERNLRNEIADFMTAF